jgi:uncharacterized membrane protein YoaT (DUF817 family)
LHDLRQIRPTQSAAAQWAPLARFITAEARLGHWAAQRPATSFVYEFLRWYPRGAVLARYDFIFLAAVAIQIGMLAFKLETFDEAKVILIYHVVGTIMELFKTDVGSWIYPEPSLFRIAGVPLFSGFMYAAIGSYIARSWRLFDLRFTGHPPLWSVDVLALAIYANFFAHHYVIDLRILLFAAAALLFGRTWVYYRIHHRYRRMPLLLGLFLVAAFIWIAENLGTFTKTWLYPHQVSAWSAVPRGKLGSWFLLLIISYALVAIVNRPEPMDRSAAPGA